MYLYRRKQERIQDFLTAEIQNQPAMAAPDYVSLLC